MRLLDSELESLFGGFALYRLVTLNVEHIAHELSVLLVVFDDEDQLVRHLMLLDSFALNLSGPAA